MESHMIFFMLIVGIWSHGLCELKFSDEVVDLISGQCTNVTLNYVGTSLENKTIKLDVDYKEIATVDPQVIKVASGQNLWQIKTCGHEAGSTIVSATAKLNNITNVSYLHVIVSKVKLLELVSNIVGWIYFLAWSVSFYPQIYTNYKRKSVVGLNFDFVALNIVGFILYSAFNCGLFYIPAIQQEYFDLHPKSLTPVMFNDVFFSVHAAFATIITIFQCLVYDRGDQQVSFVGKSILTLYFFLVLVFGTLVYLEKFSWLDFLYYCSYIKLSITIIKYIPQAYMNYSRKSTVGWSIGNVLLDFTGGAFSILQMVINGYNYNDWASFFGDPTKFGLGAFSVAFDLFFMYQHYVLYRVTNYEEHVDDEVQSHSETSESSNVVTQPNETIKSIER